MVKKNVPDWLNSSLWSSPNRHYSPPPPPHDFALKSDSSVKAEPPPPPPVSRLPEPPGSKEYPTRAAKGEIRDPLSSSVANYSDDESGFSSAYYNTLSASGFSAPATLSAAQDVSRNASLIQELSRKVISMGELRKVALQGIPDGGGIRAQVWKLLLKYLPTNRSLWPSELAKKRSQYKHIKEDILVNPSQITRRMEKLSIENHELVVRGFLSRSEISHGEHPLSLGKNSVWNQFFQDTEIMVQIDLDVKRTHPDIYFFSGDSTFAKSNQDALKNILLVFAKLNPEIRYVQGMNEILALLFYVIRNDPNERSVASAEADTFFCFSELLNAFRDNFVQLDNRAVVIRATLTRLSLLLKEHDEELWRHLEMTTQVYPHFYAFRWITLLLTREFNFADIMLIWDALLSHPDGPQETLVRICCAMLITVRKRLLAGDFIYNMTLLQNYPSTNITHLLYVATQLRPHSLS